MKEFNELPKEIQKDVKNTLRAYSEETVWFENGRYTFGVSIKAKYAPDHEYIGTYYAKDVYTEEERIVNYCEEFHSRRTGRLNPPQNENDYIRRKEIKLAERGGKTPQKEEETCVNSNLQ